MGSHLITGAAGGMGQAAARRLSGDGHKVILTDINERGRYGLETMCVGGGQGMAMILELLR